MRIRAIPLSEGELAHLTGRPLPGAPAGRQQVSYQRPLPPNFWWLWAAGTFVPMLAAILVLAADVSGSIAVPVAVLGFSFTTINVLLALSTDGYSNGDLVQVGRVVAIASGWSSVILLAVAILAAVAIVAITIFIMAAIVAGLSSK